MIRHYYDRSGNKREQIVFVSRAFAARWDETETISWTSCRKTARAFIFGTEYRYSPVSALYLFGRSQDVALPIETGVRS
jgi:hypothetical protein